MRIEDAAKVLAKMQVADQRTVGETDVLFWAEILPDWMDPQDALNGVTVYYRSNTRRIMPADLITASRQARSTRTGERMWIGD